jgi:hypothetical protein
MSFWRLLFRSRKSEEVFDPNPAVISEMPFRPYRVLHADLPFYADSDCSVEVKGARLIILRCEDPRRKHEVVECMPTRLKYLQGQIVAWDIDKDNIWQAAWYADPESGKRKEAWTQAVEFAGKVVKI